MVACLSVVVVVALGRSGDSLESTQDMTQCVTAVYALRTMPLSVKTLSCILFRLYGEGFLYDSLLSLFTQTVSREGRPHSDR
jgi:hypothetical protein